MIPMRDGVKLHTVIVVPKGASNAPILLTRTPYNATQRTTRNVSTHMLAILPEGDEVFVRAGYIRVFQDVRGKYKSEGNYVMTRPVRGPLNSTATDHVTDAYDTIDWLVKNTPESNGRVGMIGSSYEGFTVVMALLNPHPALKVAAPESPMVDGWMGDDWFHYGAFRQTNFDYTTAQTTKVRRRPTRQPRRLRRLRSLPPRRFRRSLRPRQRTRSTPLGRENDRAPRLRRLLARPSPRQVGSATPVASPNHVDSRPVGSRRHVGRDPLLPRPEAQHQEGHNYLVMGPWRHSQVNYDAFNLGPLKWQGDTALEFRRDVLRPFFDQYLKTGAPKADTPPVFIYNTGENHWDRFKNWPLSLRIRLPRRPTAALSGSPTSA